MKLGFIGLGKYGSALAQALISRAKINADNYYFYDIETSKTDPFRSDGFHCVSSWEEIVKNADVIIYGLSSTSHMAFEFAHDITLKLEKINEPRLLVRMDTLVRPMNLEEVESKVSIIRIIFGLSIKYADAPIAVLQLREESAAASNTLDKEFINVLKRIGPIFKVDDCHGLLLFRFLVGTMMIPIAQELASLQSDYSKNIPWEIFRRLLGDGTNSLKAYQKVKESTQKLIQASGENEEWLIKEIKSPGGLTEFLWPYLTPWPSTTEMIEDFVGRIKSKLCDFENRLIGVSLIASSRMVEQDLHLKPLPKTNINESIGEATRRIANYMGIYCHLWPDVFSYFSLVDNNARRINAVHRGSNDKWFDDVINQWFIKDYSDGTILVSPQRFLRKLYGYAQLAIIHGMIPSDSSEYCFSKGMIDRDLGVLLDLDVACIVRDESVSEILTKIVDNQINAEAFMSWLERFSPGENIKNTFNANFINIESNEYIIDSVIRYCIWIIGAAAKSNITWGNIFIPFSHRNALPVSLHVGIRRWIGAEQLSCLQSILSAFFMPPLEQDRHDKAMHAASAAILSRNFSHHIGSHVLPRATVKLIKERLKKLYEKDASLKTLDGKIRVSESVERLKTNLDDFIQKKADFLAEVTTDPNSSSDSKRLGRDILAPLMRNALFMDNIARNEGYGYPLHTLPLPGAEDSQWWRDTDARIKQGWEEKLSPEQIEKLNGDDYGENEPRRLAQLQMRMRSTLNLSLYISKKDNINGGTCYRIFEPDLPPYDPDYGLADNKKPEQFSVDADCAPLDPLIAVPGMVGHFALYGIVENIIRNAAKHGKKEDKGDGLHIYMHVEEEEDNEDYYRLRIWDDRTDTEKTITSPIPNQPGVNPVKRRLAKHLQSWAEEDLIDPSSEVRRDAWGVAEIVICANLLAGQRQFDYRRDVVEIVEELSPIESCNVRTCKGQDATREGTQKKLLIYRLRLLKAKRAVFVGRAFTEAWSSHMKPLNTEGVYAFATVDNLKMYFKKSEACQAFQFAVFDSTGFADVGKLDEKAREEILAKLPFRVFWIASSDAASNGMVPIPRAVRLDEDPFADLGTTPSADVIMERLWQRWIGSENTELNPYRKPVTDVVYLDVPAGAEPYEAWKSAANKFNSKPACPVKMCVRGTNGAVEGEEGGSDKTIRSAIVRHQDMLGPLGQEDMFESFGKRSADCDLLLGATLPRENHPDFWELPYALAEAGLVRILVLDERMAERAMTPYAGDSSIKSRLLEQRIVDGVTWEPCFWHLAHRAKVYIATHLALEDNTEPTPLHESFTDAESKHNAATGDTRPTCPSLKIRISSAGLKVDEYEEKIGYDSYGPVLKQRIPNTEPPKFDIVIIHQGVIDTFKPKKGNGNGDETIRKWILKKHPWLVVESGRGIPPDLQKKPIRFLSFSALDQALSLDGIGKLLLTRRLMALPRFADK